MRKSFAGMHFKIVWSPDAEKDIAGLHDYYSQRSIRATVNIFNSILSGISLLKGHPDLAAVEPLLNKRTKLYRSLVVSKGRYKVIYFVEDGYVYISRIWDCRQDPKKLVKSNLS